MTRTVAIFTGSRSEYGLLRPVIAALRDHPDLSPLVLVGGGHTRQEDGETASHIAADGFDALTHASVWTPAEGGSGLQSQAAGTLLQALGATESLAGLPDKPAWLLVYGDRSEALGAAVGAHYLGIPIAHLEAGDVTVGGMPDDRSRDAITALCTLGLTTNEDAAIRARTLTRYAVTVGLPSLATLRASEPQPERYRWDPSRPVVLLAYNPVPRTMLDAPAAEQLTTILEGIRAASPTAQVVAMLPNGDPGTYELAAAIARAPVRPMPPLPPQDYYALLATLAAHEAGACMVGNSSSALKEAPTAGLPVVNVGDRQRGRLCSPLTLHATHTVSGIGAAVTAALSRGYRDQVRDAATTWSEYGDGTAGLRIANLLASWQHG